MWVKIDIKGCSSDISDFEDSISDIKKAETMYGTAFSAFNYFSFLLFFSSYFLLFPFFYAAVNRGRY